MADPIDIDSSNNLTEAVENCSGTEGDEETQEELASAAFIMIVLFFLYISSCISHFVGNAKVGPNGEDRWYWLCLPDSMVTLLLGMMVGGLLLGGEVLDLIHNTTNRLVDSALFDVGLFNLVLLPIIIFTSGYTLNPKSLFFRQIGSIMLLAIVGTIIPAFIIGGLLFAFFGESTTLPHLGFIEMMIFGSLIAAIDPVATLSIFIRLKVDPKLSMILFGESIINDAVSIVLYTTFTTFVGLCNDIGALDVMRAIGIFFGIFIGSIALAAALSLLASLSFKYIQMHSNLHQALVMFLWSYMSFELATVCNMSGICCSLFAGIFMGYLVPKSQTEEAYKFTVDFFTVLAELSESVVFFMIGLNAVIFNHKNESEFPWIFSIATLMLCIGARYVGVIILTFAMNLRRKKSRFSWAQIMTLSHAGLRGAIAYALSLNFPVVVDGNGRSVRQLIVNVTTFVILTTVFILAPTTPPLLKCLKIPMGKDYTSGSGTAGMRPWQRKVQSINQQKIIAFFTRPPAEHAHVRKHKNTESSADPSDFLEGHKDGDGESHKDVDIELMDGPGSYSQHDHDEEI